MANSKFIKGSENQSSNFLYVANCGPNLGLTYDDIKSTFDKFGEVIGVHPADESGVRVVISFSEIKSAENALNALNGKPCMNLNQRVLHIKYSFPRQEKKVKINDHIPVYNFASELNIPGIYLVHDFITLEQEKELLKAVDERPWKNLSKRRVQHYGYKFLYETRNVDSNQFLGELPNFVSQILDKINSFPGLEDNNNKMVDQLTVNEYPSGVGLSPHIDTHSAFEDLIFSLSLASSCIMEFRKYNNNNSCTDLNAHESNSVKSRTDLDADESNSGISCTDSDAGESNSIKSRKDLYADESNSGKSCTDLDADESNSGKACMDLDAGEGVMRRAVFLPARSMLLMSGEGRYAWQHYIPHHKIDMVGGEAIKRGKRRVSFTFRKVRKGPCTCAYKQFCDSQIDKTELA